MKIRILSIEDEPDLQRLRALALVDEDFELHYAFTGPQGFEKAVSVRPNVILCDLMLPCYDGRELIVKLRADPATRDVPIIVITAYDDGGLYGEEAILRLGADVYLRKPVPSAQLTRLLRSLGAARRPSPSSAA